MNPWVESFGVALLAACGVLMGAWFSRLPKGWWLLGYFIPLTMVVLYSLGSRFPALTVVPPISWMMLGRIKFAIIGFIAGMVLTTPLLRLPLRRDRRVVAVLMVVVIYVASIRAFLAPAFNHQQLAALVTRIDRDGVCLQNTAYTCGPASAVTALRRLGFAAEEGELAILAHTTDATGTPPDILADALRTRYGKEGLVSEYRVFKGVAELKSCGLTLAVVKFGLLVDHYVAVLQVTDSHVIVGDPLNGKTELTIGEFQKLWRFSGVVLWRGARKSQGQAAAPPCRGFGLSIPPAWFILHS